MTVSLSSEIVFDIWLFSIPHLSSVVEVREARVDAEAFVWVYVPTVFTSSSSVLSFTVKLVVMLRKSPASISNTWLVSRAPFPSTVTGMLKVPLLELAASMDGSSLNSYSPVSVL